MVVAVVETIYKLKYFNLLSMKKQRKKVKEIGKSQRILSESNFV